MAYFTDNPLEYIISNRSLPRPFHSLLYTLHFIHRLFLQHCPTSTHTFFLAPFLPLVSLLFLPTAITEHYLVPRGQIMRMRSGS